MSYLGDSDAIDKFKASMPSFTSKFSEGRFAETYTLPAPKREAILINSPVQYVCIMQACQIMKYHIALRVK